MMSPYSGAPTRPPGERRHSAGDLLLHALEHELAHVVLERRHHRIETDADGGGAARERRLVSGRRSKRVPGRIIDPGLERGARAAHDPVVIGFRGSRERGREAALLSCAETEGRDPAEDLAGHPSSCALRAGCGRSRELCDPARRALRSTAGADREEDIGRADRVHQVPPTESSEMTRVGLPIPPPPNVRSLPTPEIDESRPRRFPAIVMPWTAY